MTPTKPSEVRKLWIEGPAGRLEAALRVACPARAAAVVAHPHPVHGGTMHNPVVFHAERELHRAGLTTLRFNFRGVGSSEGVHDEGPGELADLASATAWLRGVALGVPLLLVGYSFGGMCAVRHASEDRTIAAVIAIGLPVRLYDLPQVGTLGRPLAVVQGSVDEFGSPEEVQQVLDLADPRGSLRVIAGAAHLFTERAQEAAVAVVLAAESILSR